MGMNYHFDLAIPVATKCRVKAINVRVAGTQAKCSIAARLEVELLTCANAKMQIIRTVDILKPEFSKLEADEWLKGLYNRLKQLIHDYRRQKDKKYHQCNKNRTLKMRTAMLITGVAERTSVSELKKVFNMLHLQ